MAKCLCFPDAHHVDSVIDVQFLLVSLFSTPTAASCAATRPGSAVEARVRESPPRSRLSAFALHARFSGVGLRGFDVSPQTSVTIRFLSSLSSLQLHLFLRPWDHLAESNGPMKPPYACADVAVLRAYPPHPHSVSFGLLDFFPKPTPSCNVSAFIRPAETDFVLALCQIDLRSPDDSQFLSADFVSKNLGTVSSEQSNVLALLLCAR